MRLNQFIASCGVCSRREADKLIQSGRVMVNGSLPSSGMQVTEDYTVEVNGKPLSKEKEIVVLAYYKPVGVVCTEKDKHAERNVIDEIGYSKRVTYAGRLDKDSEGLLILTNDGKLIDAMMKGSKKHEKEYLVTVDKPVTWDFLNKMANGVYLSDLDRTTRPCKIKRTGKSSFDIILTQGLNRQIRRMCHVLGYEVKTLKRTRVMCIDLKDYDIKAGEYIELRKETVSKLYSQAGLKT